MKQKHPIPSWSRFFVEDGLLVVGTIEEEAFSIIFFLKAIVFRSIKNGDGTRIKDDRDEDSGTGRLLGYPPISRAEPHSK